MANKITSATAEQQRLERQRAGKQDWRLWGPYLAERAWGTVREDYSAYGEAWDYFSHDQARSRTYRWNEDGLGGICDEQQRLCFALTLWNGSDPILKERAFGLTGSQGNRGEDVKEYYFYLDATPSHSYLHYLYKYPQQAFPYQKLVEENHNRGRDQPPFTLLDSGAFADNRYWDVEVRYAKAAPDQIHIHILASNHGPQAATLHLLPTLWFRNDWDWGGVVEPPQLAAAEAPEGAQWAVQASHTTLGKYFLYGREQAVPLYTDNTSNSQLLWGQPGAPYSKDAFHRRVVNGEQAAVNPAQQGSKFAAWHELTVEAGAQAELHLVLSAQPLAQPFAEDDTVFRQRQAEADAFYQGLLQPNGSATHPPSNSPLEGGSENFLPFKGRAGVGMGAPTTEDARIFRQAMAGMIWSKQFFHYDVARWLDGDQLPPPDGHKHGRNRRWRHMKAANVISMPDAWEYPWFAAWDLAFHCAALALVDVDFAKGQLELLLKENYLHPSGQIPAYEWAFDDVNPPVIAMAALKVFRAERVQRGQADTDFLQRVFHKLLMNYTWWLNSKDGDGNNVFEGGFLGLDNISVYDRSQPLPAGYRLKQADATGWMAMFSLNLTMMALELAAEDHDYEDIAIQCYTQFLGVANTIAGHGGGTPSLWDSVDGFFKDLVVGPDGSHQRIDVFSWVGIIPLFACEIVDQRLLKNAPRFNALLTEHMGGLFDGHHICACPYHKNERGEHLLSLVDYTMLPHIVRHLLNDHEFLSPYGIRSVSKIHAEQRDLGTVHGIGRALIEYVPGESNSGLFGGNSNWRGPVWMPTNYTLLQALEKFHRYLGDNYKVAVPCVDYQELTLAEISRLVSGRLVDLWRRNEGGLRPVFPADSPFQHDPHWRDLLLFHEYFHGDNGLGLGAMHQTGWTGLVANLVQRHYRSGIPDYWRRQGVPQP